MYKSSRTAFKNMIFVVFLAYILFSALYHITLRINQFGFSGKALNYIFDPLIYWKSGGLHYLIFLIFSIPIYYLIFYAGRNWKSASRYAIHLIALPLFVVASQQTYYSIADAYEWAHLEGRAQVWDIYIPSLIYLIQFGFLHAYEYYQRNQEKLRVEGELRQAALNSELAAIKAQLNPHFLYNVFNTINASVPAEQEETRRMIAELSDLFRYQLRASREELVTLQEELEFVNKYLALEKARFQDRLQIEIDVPEELYKRKIPPMILQPIVENSVKHGISGKVKGGKIIIKVFDADGKLHFEITDTGVGIEDKEGIFEKGIGLSNTRKRLLKGYQSTLEVLDNNPSGLTIRFSL